MGVKSVQIYWSFPVPKTQANTRPTGISIGKAISSGVDLHIFESIHTSFHAIFESLLHIEIDYCEANHISGITLHKYFPCEP
jgi:hypothetical protein